MNDFHLARYPSQHSLFLGRFELDLQLVIAVCAEIQQATTLPASRFFDAPAGVSQEKRLARMFPRPLDLLVDPVRASHESCGIGCSLVDSFRASSARVGE